MMNNFQIVQHLKHLKLSGIAENLELRLLEAQNNGLSYSEFLGMLLEDESEKRTNRKIKRLIHQAGLEHAQTIENFDFTFNPNIPAQYIRELSTCRFIDKGENIFFLGPTGTGKTHLTQAFCINACRKHFKVGYFKFYQLFEQFKQAQMSDTLNRLLYQLNKLDLLAIDDFAFRDISKQDAQIFYALVDQRYKRKSMILNSNRDISDWINIFPDPIIANAILDRLAHNAHQIVLKGESYRKKFRQLNEKI